MREWINLIEGRQNGIHEVYHWTSAERLIRILNDARIETGASTHNLGGKTLHGVSVTRDAFLDLTNTYAVSGRKAWRIGLDYNKLRERLRVLPIRDEYLRDKPMRGVSRRGTDIFGRGGYQQSVSSDEAEEFVLGDIPLDYFTSIAVEDAHVDVTAHPRDIDEDPEYYAEEFDLEGEDAHLFFSIVAILQPDIFRYMTRRKPYRPLPILYPDTLAGDPVPFYLITRSPHNVVSLEQSTMWIARQMKEDA